MKKLIYLIVLLLCLPILHSCFLFSYDWDDEDYEWENDDSYSAPTLGEQLIDTTINVYLSDAIISLPEGITVIVPKGLSDSDFELSIHSVDITVNTPSEMQLLNAFNVELSIGEEFEKDITIRIDFDRSIIKDENTTSDFAFGFYNEYNKKWAVFSDYEINLDLGYAECRTNHLTTVGVWEFLTTGGYSYKFIGDNVTVYYSLTGSDAPMSNYLPDDQPWHLPSGSKTWSPLYVQDIAHYTAEARKIFAQSPHNLNVSKGNINIYIKDLEGSDGEYGTISGAIYINNEMTLPGQVSGIEYEDVLKATCAHELMHYIQDNYYVMNKGTIGMWWLEATATQADRMVWGNNLLYSESELFSIESNSTLLDNLSKSWDDCNNNPSWYLSGCFLQYMSTYRKGSKFNVASAVKAGGSGLSLVRIMLNDQIKSQLGTDISTEFLDYVLYLFGGGNEKLSAIPFNNDINALTATPSFTTQVKMSKKDNTQSVDLTLPYLSAKLINVANIENSKMRYSYQYIKAAPSVEAYLCELDIKSGTFTNFERLYKDKTGDIELEGRTGGNMHSFAILLVNSSIAKDKDEEVKFIFQTAPDFQDFDYMIFILEGESGDFVYSNGASENTFKIGFVKFKGVDYDGKNFKVASKSFAGNKIKLNIEETGDRYSPSGIRGYLYNFVQKVEITGEYDMGEFIILNIKEELNGETGEVWSDKKNAWVKHTIKSSKEIEYASIPFNVVNSEYGNVYAYLESNKDKIKTRLKKISHSVTEYDDENKVFEQYSLQPLNWNNLSNWFSVSMTTTK